MDIQKTEEREEREIRERLYERGTERHDKEEDRLKKKVGVKRGEGKRKE